MNSHDEPAGRDAPEREIAEHYEGLMEAVRKRVGEINEKMLPAVEEAFDQTPEGKSEQPEP